MERRATVTALSALAFGSAALCGQAPLPLVSHSIGWHLAVSPLVGEVDPLSWTQAVRDAGIRTDGATSAEREELRTERDILAKAAVWFAREPGTVPGESSDS